MQYTILEIRKTESGGAAMTLQTKARAPCSGGIVLLLLLLQALVYGVSGRNMLEDTGEERVGECSTTFEIRMNYTLYTVRSTC